MSCIVFGLLCLVCVCVQRRAAVCVAVPVWMVLWFQPFVLVWYGGLCVCDLGVMCLLCGAQICAAVCGDTVQCAQWSAAVLLSCSAFLFLVCWGTNTPAHAGGHKTQWL